MGAGVQVAGQRDLKLLVGYLSLQLQRGRPVWDPGEAPGASELITDLHSGHLGTGWCLQITRGTLPPEAHLGDGDVIAAATRAQLPGAGVNGAVGGSEAARAGGPCRLHALQSGLKLSHLK